MQYIAYNIKKMNRIQFIGYNAYNTVYGMQCIEVNAQSQCIV